MIDLDKLAEDWKSGLVARTRIEEFTQGMYKASTMSVFDSLGVGILPRYKIGKKVFYKTEDIINWIRKKKEK